MTNEEERAASERNRLLNISVCEEVAGPQYAIAGTGYVFENEDGTRRKIVAFERTELHKGQDGLWNPREGDEKDVLIAFENPDVNEDEFEADIVLSPPDAVVFAFSILEAAGIDVAETEAETGEEHIYVVTRSATASLYEVDVPDVERA